MAETLTWWFLACLKVDLLYMTNQSWMKHLSLLWGILLALKTCFGWVSIVSPLILPVVSMFAQLFLWKCLQLGNESVFFCVRADYVTSELNTFLYVRMFLQSTNFGRGGQNQELNLLLLPCLVHLTFLPHFPIGMILILAHIHPHLQHRVFLLQVHRSPPSHSSQTISQPSTLPVPSLHPACTTSHVDSSNCSSSLVVQDIVAANGGT